MSTPYQALKDPTSDTFAHERKQSTRSVHFGQNAPATDSHESDSDEDEQKRPVAGRATVDAGRVYRGAAAGPGHESEDEEESEHAYGSLPQGGMSALNYPPPLRNFQRSQTVSVLNSAGPSSKSKRKRKDTAEKLPSIQISRSTTLYDALLPRQKSKRFATKVDLAAKYIKDAHYGRSVELRVRDTTSPVVYALAYIHRSFWWDVFVKVVIALHCALIIPEGGDYHRSVHKWMAWVEIVFLAVYWIDISAGLVSEHPNRYILNYWNFSYLLAVFLMSLDIIVTMASESVDLDILRLLRPVLFLFKTKTLRTPFITMLSILPRITDALVLMVVLVSFYSVVGVAIFHGVYIDDYQNFDNFYWASLAMTTLLTTENFPDIFLPGAYHAPAWAGVYFCSFIAIGVWVYMALLLAAIFDEYKKGHEENVIKRRVEEHEALLIAFTMLTEDSHTIDYRIFKELLLKIRPKVSDEEARVLFKLIDQDCNGDVDAEEFLRFIDILNYRVVEITRSYRVDDGLPVPTWKKIWYHIYYASYPYLQQQVLEQDWYKRAVQINLLANCLVIVMWHQGMSENFARSLDAVNAVCVTLMVIESIVKVMALGLKEALHSRGDRFDFALIWFSLILEISSPSSVTTLDSTRVNFLQLFRALRILRVVTLWKHIKLMARALAKGLSTLMRLCVLVGILIYIYGVIGMEAFHDRAQDPAPVNGTSLHTTLVQPVAPTYLHAYSAVHLPPASASDTPSIHSFLANLATSFYTGAEYGVTPPANPSGFSVQEIHFYPEGWDPEKFHTFWGAMISLFQIATSNNWNDVMYKNIQDWWDAMYFVSFYFLVCTIINSIVTALIIDTYTVFMETYKSSVQDSVYVCSSPCPSPRGQFMSPSHGSQPPDMSLGPAASPSGSPPPGTTGDYQALNASPGPYGTFDNKDHPPPPQYTAIPKAPHVHEYSRGLLKDPAHETHRVWRIYKEEQWSRMLVMSSLPELRKKEIEALRTRIVSLQGELDKVAVANGEAPRDPHVGELHRPELDHPSLSASPATSLSSAGFSPLVDAYKMRAIHPSAHVHPAAARAFQRAEAQYDTGGSNASAARSYLRVDVAQAIDRKRSRSLPGTPTRALLSRAVDDSKLQSSSLAIPAPARVEPSPIAQDSYFFSLPSHNLPVPNLRPLRHGSDNQ